MSPELARLQGVLKNIGPLAVAVSGGVDSTTLAAVAHRTLVQGATMLHATSPAVPAEATERVRDHAVRFGWRLRVVDAREFDDPNYMANPHNRCFYCKSNLYATMSSAIDSTLVSGTNTDDLGDYRPGLQAAAEHRVRHPFVEAGLDKAGVRAIARELALHDLAELPASPCLSSRVETGIAIDPRVLGAVHRAEKLVQQTLSPDTVRCRVRADAVVIELDPASMQAMEAATGERLSAEVQRLMTGAGVNHRVSFQPYRMGSAFLRPADET